MLSYHGTVKSKFRPVAFGSREKFAIPHVEQSYYGLYFKHHIMTNRVYYNVFLLFVWNRTTPRKPGKRDRMKGVLVKKISSNADELKYFIKYINKFLDHPFLPLISRWFCVIWRL